MGRISIKYSLFLLRRRNFNFISFCRNPHKRIQLRKCKLRILECNPKIILTHLIADRSFLRINVHLNDVSDRWLSLLKLRKYFILFDLAVFKVKTVSLLR